MQFIRFASGWNACDSFIRNFDLITNCENSVLNVSQNIQWNEKERNTLKLTAKNWCMWCMDIFFTFNFYFSAFASLFFVILCHYVEPCTFSVNFCSEYRRSCSAFAFRREIFNNINFKFQRVELRRYIVFFFLLAVM